MHIGASYLTRALDRQFIDEAVKDAVENLSRYDFDTIAFLGMSGACFAPLIAREMHKELIMVRRNFGHDGSGSKRPAEGNAAAKRYIIIDDLVASGQTAGTIVYGVEDFCARTFSDAHPEFVGIYQYNYNRFDRPGDTDYETVRDQALKIRRLNVGTISNSNG